MDYSRLDFPDAHFDGVYTMETLVFAPDCARTLAGFHRVLEPGGRLALFEYSVPAREDMTDVERRLFDEVVADTAMESLPGFVHGGFPALLREAGFEDVAVEDLTERMLPMVRWLARLLWLPYQLGRPLGLRRRMVNALATIEAARRPGRWRYNVVTATRPA
jgi:SAM-dependent methyltransferase